MAQLYYKVIDEQIVISSCKTIYVDGAYIANPTEEMILADGWLPYTPPPVVPEPQQEPDYYAVVDAIKKMFSADTEELSDEDALKVAALYPTWHSKLESGEDCVVNERLWYDGDLWRVIQTHTPQESWNPRDAVSLFVRVTIEEWPAWVQPTGATDAYRLGAQVTHNDLHWISEIDYNTYEPGVYGWRQP